MLLRTVTMISFIMPEEYQDMLNFEMNNDLTFWDKQESSQMTTFIHTSISTTTTKDKKDDNK